MTIPTAPQRSLRRRHRGRARRGAVVAVALSGLVALSPVAAHARPAGLVVAAAAEEEGEGEAPARRPIAETPRDVFALTMLASLVGAAVIGTANARRQLRGERPSADGRFRWR